MGRCALARHNRKGLKHWNTVGVAPYNDLQTMATKLNEPVVRCIRKSVISLMTPRVTIVFG